MKTKFIKLTSYNTNQPIYLNVDMIGNIYQNTDCTTIGHLTHRNGGFQVIEDVEEVLDLINEITNNL
jgi:uncharacterized protein YlzI (FlbEa/FlbD family)